VLGASAPLLAAPATVTSSVQAIDEGKYLIKISVTPSKDGIFGFALKDPTGSILDVYSPKGWCMLSDGDMCLSRTDGPMKVGKAVEFVIQSSSKDAKFVWTFFGEMEQIGKPEVL